jgi:hypothetical protein
MTFEIQGHGRAAVGHSAELVEDEGNTGLAPRKATMWSPAYYLD